MDVKLLMQTEVAEVYEPFHEGRGSSSTMPQKRNPIASLYIHSTAALVRQHVAALLGGRGRRPRTLDRARGRSSGFRCRKFSCSRRARWRRPSSWWRASRSTRPACAPISISRCGMIVSEAVMMGLGPASRPPARPRSRLRHLPQGRGDRQRRWSNCWRRIAEISSPSDATAARTDVRPGELPRPVGRDGRPGACPGKRQDRSRARLSATICMFREALLTAFAQANSRGIIGPQNRHWYA